MKEKEENKQQEVKSARELDSETSFILSLDSTQLQIFLEAIEAGVDYELNYL